MSKLTDKQKRFADEYLICLNATQSAIKAGYSEKGARVQGQRMLTNANIQTYLNERLEKISDKKIADAQEVMEYLTSVLRGEEKEECVVVEGSGDGVTSARIIEKVVSPKDRIKSAELLAKRYGLLTDKIEADINIKPTVIGGGEELE